MPSAPEGFRSVERVGLEGTIETEQWLDVPHAIVTPSEEGARALGSSYWREVGRVAHGLVHGRETGSGVEVRLVTSRPVLLRLGPGEVTIHGDRVACRYAIRGGLLARRPGGALTLSQSGGGRPELRVAVHGFFPRLAAKKRARWSGALYRLELRLHVSISRRWLRSLAEDGLR